MKVFIVGYMYSGKTTLGKKLAKKLGKDFFDIDQYFEQKYKISVQDFFEKYDEGAFRKLEKDILAEIIQKDDFVLSTGGGTPCFYGNMDLINKSGISVYLKMAPVSIAHRALNSRKPRPLFKNLSDSEIPAFIRRHLAEREYFYKTAHIQFKGENARVEELISRIHDFSE